MSVRRSSNDEVYKTCSGEEVESWISQQVGSMDMTAEGNVAYMRVMILGEIAEQLAGVRECLGELVNATNGLRSRRRRQRSYIVRTSGGGGEL